MTEDESGKSNPGNNYFCSPEDSSLFQISINS